MVQPAAIPVQPSPRLPKASLLALIRTLSGVPVYWTTDRRGVAGQSPGQERAWILIDAQSLEGIGVDEVRMQYDTVTGNNDVVMVGQRRFTMPLHANSYDATLEAFDLCERVRFRLRTQTAQAIFSPAGLSLRDIQAIQTLPNRSVTIGGSERLLLCANMDVRWNWTAVADPLDPNEGGWIENVDGAAVIPFALLP